MDDEIAELCAEFERLAGMPSWTMVGTPVRALRQVVGWMRSSRARGVDVGGLVRQTIGTELLRLAAEVGWTSRAAVLKRQGAAAERLAVAPSPSPLETAEAALAAALERFDRRVEEIAARSLPSCITCGARLRIHIGGRCYWCWREAGRPDGEMVTVRGAR